jgi:outer membrane protein assembly factor BamB
MVFVAKTDEGRIVALDAASGKTVWHALLGGRVDGPPTIHRGLCLVGCRDGWLYALSVKDGRLAWRTRVAPRERRIVAHGQVECIWPAFGTVLAHGGAVYATGGRTTQSDGGVAVLAVDLATGATVWGKGLPPGTGQWNGLLTWRNKGLGWQNLLFDPQTGKPLQLSKDEAPEPAIGEFRTGRSVSVGAVTRNHLAWNGSSAVWSWWQDNASVPREKLNGKTALKPEDFLWKTDLPKGAQVEGLVLASNAAVYACSMPEVQDGKARWKGFLHVVSMTDGKKVMEVPLGSPPARDGVAVAEKRLFVSLRNGQLVCFDEGTP